MKELVELLAKNIVEKTDEVKASEGSDELGQKITLSVASEDMGRIIGKSGRIIKAIRALLRIKAIKEGKRVYLELAERPANSSQRPATKDQ
jgi:hypothetical protein